MRFVKGRDQQRRVHGATCTTSEGIGWQGSLPVLGDKLLWGSVAGSCVHAAMWRKGPVAVGKNCDR